jgi:hypothetical protein
MSEIISFRVSDERYDDLEELAAAMGCESVGGVVQELIAEKEGAYQSAIEIARLRVDLARALSLEDELIGEAEQIGDGSLPPVTEVARMETLFSDMTVGFVEAVGPASAVGEPDEQGADEEEEDDWPDRERTDGSETNEEAVEAGEMDTELFDE